MELSAITDNAIIYVLIAWAAIVIGAKALKLEGRGVEIKPYSIVYKNAGVQNALDRMLGRTRRGIRVFADVSVVAGFAMMGFAFWFLISNILAYFERPAEFAEVTVLIPGVTLTSSSAILNFLLSIPIVLVMHEGAHGIVAALEKIRIKTGGFAVFIALFAGFVEPDEEEFDKAKKISKLRVIGAGATSNVIFALALSILLLTNPVFALVMPEPLRGAFYDEEYGVKVVSLIDGFGAESAGIAKGDIIVGINGMEVKNAFDMSQIPLKPGETAQISVLRGGEETSYAVEIGASPDDEEVGLVGITRNPSEVRPVLDVIDWKWQGSAEISLFLLWLWMISFFIGVINMLPLPILDGGKFVSILLEGRVSEKGSRAIMWGIYAFTFLIFALNIGLSYAKSGWFTI